MPQHTLAAIVRLIVARPGAKWRTAGATFVVVHGAAHFRVAVGAANAPGDAAAAIIGRLTGVARPADMAIAECQLDAGGASTGSAAGLRLLCVMVVLMLVLMAATTTAGLMCRWLIAAGVVMVRR